MAKSNRNLPAKQEEEVVDNNYRVEDIVLTKKQAFVAFAQEHHGNSGIAIAEIINEEKALANATLNRIIVEGKDGNNDGFTYYTAVLDLPESKSKEKDEEPK